MTQIKEEKIVIIVQYAYVLNAFEFEYIIANSERYKVAEYCSVRKMSYLFFYHCRYYYSYWTIEPEGPHNGELGHDPNNTLKSSHEYFYWYDTYPLEFGVFLLDSALARGVYFHTMAANDAFYERCTY